MIAKSITVLHNDYGIFSDEQREEILKLRKAENGGRSPAFRHTCLYAGGIQKTAGDDLSARMILPPQCEIEDFARLHRKPAAANSARSI